MRVQMNRRALLKSLAAAICWPFAPKPKPAELVIVNLDQSGTPDYWAPDNAAPASAEHIAYWRGHALTIERYEFK